MRAVFTSFSLVFAAVGATSGCKKFIKGSKTNEYNRSDTTWRDPEDHPNDVMHVVDGGGRSGANGPAGGWGTGKWSILEEDLGHPGGRGGDGAPGVSGTSSGDIDVTLSYAGSASRFSVVGEIRKDGGTIEPVNYTGDVDSPGYVLLNANGGKGGDGGAGGPGGHGARGKRGRQLESKDDASKGETGGRGGDGGDGKDGGDGGSAGKVTLKVPHDQTELLWLVRVQNFGGPGGALGGAGTAGGGGPGGLLGAAFAYREEEDYRTTDANGKPVTKQWSPIKQNTNTQFGDAGVSGKDGKAGQRGRDGLDNVSKILVTGGGADVEYEKMFELQLSDVQLEDQFNDGVLEPGETFHVRRFTFKNVQSMPTPLKKTTFTLVPKGDLKIAGHTGEVSVEAEGGIAGNRERSWDVPPNAQTFKVNDFVSDVPSKPEAIQLYPGVEMGGKRMALETGKNFVVKAPGIVFDENAELTNRVLFDQKPKRKVLRVRNQSSIPYGPGSPLQRSFKLVLRHKEILPPNEQKEPIAPVKAKDVLLNFTKSGAQGGPATPVTMEAEIVIDVPPLEPGADLEVPFDVMLSDQVLTPGAHFGIEMELYVSPDSGQAPTKLIHEDLLTFVSSVDPELTYDARILIFNRGLSCHFPNLPKKNRMIEELWIQKTHNPKKSDIENLAFKLQFDPTWWAGTVKEPKTFVLNVKDSVKYWRAFQEPTSKTRGLSDELLMDLFTEIFIPQANWFGKVDPGYIKECSWLESRRKNILLQMANKELNWFRGSGKNYHVLPARW